MFRQAAYRAIASSRSLRAHAPSSFARFAHSTASSSQTMQGRAGLMIGMSTVIAYYTWKLSTENRILQDEAHTNDTPAPSVIQHKSEEYSAEIAAESATSSTSVPSTDSVIVDAALPQSETPEADVDEEDARSAAFNPVTGEINWDCPCLGGMAHGPCGPEFREAFSCFIYSEKEPKGIDCVEKFKHMQDCFRAHPDVYGEEIDDDDQPSAVPQTQSHDVEVAPVDEEEPVQVAPVRKIRSRYED
ncbi:Oxidoreductase [Tulasnella sp. 419]|nr:Oxidoreductase [Tulasnella sp. 418]KAG8970015.1 Oxidoreductase [Tulasnella sp. 419]